MARRQVVKQQPVQRTHSVAELAGKRHSHFCRDRECRNWYEDACSTPEKNDLCHTCIPMERRDRSAPERPRWAVARDPRECCIGNCAQVTDRTEIKRYSLAGPGPWFQCKTCARCHGWPCATPNERKKKS